MSDQPIYPHDDGDVTVLGPEIFASRDGVVISWRGENYVRQAASVVSLDDQHPKDGPLSYDDICAAYTIATNRADDAETAIAGLAQALRLTREYVGEELLPATDGWSWYDALRRWAPHELLAATEAFEYGCPDCGNPITVGKRAEHRCGQAGQSARTTPDNPVTSTNPTPCGHCSHPADWHDLHEGCVGPNGIGGLGSGDCTCTRNPDQAATAADTSWQPDETLDYGHLPPPAADPDAPLRTGNSLPPASDGPTVREAAADDRRWDTERAGE